jgi:hypothetical protein
MTTTATYPKQPQPARWSPVMGMFHGMECPHIGSNPEVIPGRLGKGINPGDAGR